MEFRWAAAIALWTILSGPVFEMPRWPSSPPTPHQVSATERAEQPQR